MAVNEAASVPAIALHDVGVAFGGTSVLDRVDLTVPAGRCTCIVGSSGSGKTTLLRLVNGLLKPDTGSVRVGPYDVDAPGANIDALRRHAGMVLQGACLFPHKTALENVAMGQRHILGRPAMEARDRALALMERLGVAEQAGRWPKGLSAGQQQRVALARALAMDPKILLLDEVTAALDATMAGEIATLLRESIDDGMTVLAASHDERFVALLADEVFRLAGGRLVAVGHKPALVREVS